MQINLIIENLSILIDQFRCWTQFQEASNFFVQNLNLIEETLDLRVIRLHFDLFGQLLYLFFPLGVLIHGKEGLFFSLLAYFCPILAEKHIGYVFFPEPLSIREEFLIGKRHLLIWIFAILLVFELRSILNATTRRVILRLSFRCILLLFFLFLLNSWRFHLYFHFLLLGRSLYCRGLILHLLRIRQASLESRLYAGYCLIIKASQCCFCFLSRWVYNFCWALTPAFCVSKQ